MKEINVHPGDNIKLKELRDGSEYLAGRLKIKIDEYNVFLRRKRKRTALAAWHKLSRALIGRPAPYSYPNPHCLN